MEIVPLTPDLRAAWDEFCLASPDAWFWHTTAWLDYHLAYRPEMAQRSVSFLCKEGPRILAAVPLLAGVERVDGRERRVFGYSGIPNPSPALAADLTPIHRAKLLETIFGLIEGLAKELGIAYARFQVPPLSPGFLKSVPPHHNHLMRHGYLDCSVAVQVVDLRVDDASLRACLRRDHERNIEKARETLRVRVHSGAELTDAKFDEYRLMHARAAGRVTRPLETFRMMRDWIRSGDGFIAEAVQEDGRAVGFETFHGYKKAVYSMSACNEPGLDRLPIRHLLQWESILWMRERGYEWYEVGDQQFGTLPYDFPTPKQLDISLFKSGFGGAAVPSVRAERFYTKAAWEEEHARRAAAFAAGDAWSRPDDSAGARALLKLADEAGRPRPVRPEETEPIPDSARDLATAAAAANPDAVQRYRNGSTKAVAFLVGAAMQKAPKGLDPRLVRRAVEEHLAKTVASTEQT